MEVIPGWTHQAFEVRDLSSVGEARRHVARLCSERQWGEVDAARAALVATELGTNLAKHALQGQLLIAARDPFGDIEILSADAGPGIADVARAMRDGVSTASTAGNGLGAVRRQSDEFDLHSTLQEGTVCVARVRPGATGLRPPASFSFGAVCVPLRGETQCGDSWVVVLDGDRAALMVADGLGHGPEAAQASQAAVAVFSARAFEPVDACLQAVHTALRTTRGAAVSALWLQGDEVLCAGAGNVAGRLISGTEDKSVLTQHGTLGLMARSFKPSAMTRPAHSTALLHTDGIASRWSSEALRPLLRRDPVLLALRIHADHSRGRDDVCVLVARPEEAA
ncbi:MAG: histidine kinase [Comamonadaceae bacterium]|nr:MAG: histidine kinase [Comamonadaceae bacterium]